MKTNPVTLGYGAKPFGRVIDWGDPANGSLSGFKLRNSIPWRVDSQPFLETRAEAPEKNQ